MPERKEDSNKNWRYDTNYPGANLKRNPVGVAMPALVEAVGLDGRFVGSLRPFPGMADSTIHGIPAPGDGDWENGVHAAYGDEVASIANIVFTKYASVQKGVSKHTLSGLVIIGDSPAGYSGSGVAKALYFAYRDSEDNLQHVVCLDSFDRWKDYWPTELVSGSFDVTSQGRYIYLVVSGATGARTDGGNTFDHMSGKAGPWNRAYWWDFEINNWDRFNHDGGELDASGEPRGSRAVGYENQWQPRFLGTLPYRLLDTKYNEEGDGAWMDASDTAFEVEFVEEGSDVVNGNINYNFAAMLVSRKHRLRTPLRWHRAAFATDTTGRTLGWSLKKISQPWAYPSNADNAISDSSGEGGNFLSSWGIPHVDGVRLYRTTHLESTDSGYEDPANLKEPYELQGYLYLARAYEELPAVFPSVAAGDHPFSYSTLRVRHNTNPDTYPDDVVVNAPWDPALILQEQYDPYMDEWGPAPRMKKLISYNGILVGVTDIEAPINADTSWEEAEQRVEEFCWSSLATGEPENFPAANRVPVDEPAEKVLSLELVGGHVFGVSTGGVYRLTRSGTSMAVDNIATKVGGVSHYGQTGVGSSLFVLTRGGMKEFDGNTGEQKSVTVLDRIVQDDSEWAGSLASVQMEYDAALGALVLLNTSTREAYLLWENTGAVTKLEGCPWSWITSGPDVKVAGPRRVYWVTSSGVTHVVDVSREMGFRGYHLPGGLRGWNLRQRSRV
jgi:hypothetical protein